MRGTCGESGESRVERENGGTGNGKKDKGKGKIADGLTADGKNRNSL
jgi:hypothetical protein